MLLFIPLAKQVGRGGTRRLSMMLVASAVLILTGCATSKPLEPAKDPVADVLAKSAASVADSLRKMSEVEGTSKVVIETPNKQAPQTVPVSNLQPVLMQAPVTYAPPPAPVQIVQPASSPAPTRTPQVDEQPRQSYVAEAPIQGASRRGLPATAADAPAVSEPALPKTRGAKEADTGYVRSAPATQAAPEKAPPVYAVPQSAYAAQPAYVTPQSYPAPTYQNQAYPAQNYAPAPSYGAPQGYQNNAGVQVSVMVNANSGVPGAVLTPQGPGNPVISNAPQGLGRPLSISWTEDSAEELVALICRETGWTKGQSVGLPISPKRVTIYSEGKSAYAILQEIGAQLNRSANIVIAPENHSIFLTYPVR